MNFEQLNPAACRTYLISDGETGVIIDPVIDHVSDYLNIINNRKLVLTHVVDTHTHADHISAGPSLRDATDCEYVMHELAPAKCVTMRVKNNDKMILAGKEALFLETPGHTRDSISILIDNILLTGDFLFLEDAGAGRDDLPGGDPRAHWESLQKLENMTGDIMIYPAHEYRDRIPSTLENQRKLNPYLKIKSENEFVSYINDLKLGPADWMKEVLSANYKCATDPKAAWIPTDVPACETKGTLNPNANDIDIEFIAPKQLNEEDGLVLIDVREQYELVGQLGHIEGVINIPVGQLTHKLEELEKFKDDKIIIICRSGSRAVTAAQILILADFKKVRVLEGGMNNYNQKK